MRNRCDKFGTKKGIDTSTFVEFFFVLDIVLSTISYLV